MTAKFPGALCEECGDVFFCEHQRQKVQIGLAIKKMFEEQNEQDRQHEALNNLEWQKEEIIPDDRDITGSD